MAINWTFGRKLAAGFSIAVLTLLLIGVSGYRSTAHLIENERWVSHTHEVRTKLADLISALKDAEGGQRGFVITADETFLEPYRASLPEIARLVSPSITRPSKGGSARFSRWSRQSWRF